MGIEDSGMACMIWIFMSLCTQVRSFFLSVMSTTTAHTGTHTRNQEEKFMDMKISSGKKTTGQHVCVCPMKVKTHK